MTSTAAGNTASDASSTAVSTMSGLSVFFILLFCVLIPPFCLKKPCDFFYFL